MKKIIFKISSLIIAFNIGSFALAQAIPGTLNWYNGEGVGMYTNKAYKMLKKKKSNESNW